MNLDWINEQEEADLRFEASRIQQEDEEDLLRQEAGCNDECEPDCTCVQEYLDAIRERREINQDFYASRGI